MTATGRLNGARRLRGWTAGRLDGSVERWRRTEPQSHGRHGGKSVACETCWD